MKILKKINSLFIQKYNLTELLCKSRDAFTKNDIYTAFSNSINKHSYFSVL